MPAKNRNATEVADLVLQLGRAAYADCSADGLTQAQWIAMRYFSRANRFSRTVSGFAEFHATTRGTASQTIKSLVAKGYLSRRASDRDGRSVRFDLTSLATRKLGSDPLEDVVRAVEKLTAAQQQVTAAGLRAALGELEKSRAANEKVGICRLCGYLETRSANTGNRCRLMREALETSELEELCIRHEAKT